MRPLHASWTTWVFRLVSTAAAVLLFDQAVFAGRFLSGDYPALHLHRENATFAGVAMLFVLAAAILVWRPGRGPWWPIAACGGLFGLIAAQIALGFAQVLAIHIPLGVSIILLSAALAVWGWIRL